MAGCAGPWLLSHNPETLDPDPRSQACQPPAVECVAKGLGLGLLAVKAQPAHKHHISHSGPPAPMQPPTCHGQMCRAVAALVAQAPQDDAGVVLVALAHVDGPVQEGVRPQGVAGGHHRIVVQRRVEAVGLAVGLVHEVDAVLVAQLVPARGASIQPVDQGYVLNPDYYRAM